MQSPRAGARLYSAHIKRGRRHDQDSRHRRQGRDRSGWAARCLAHGHDVVAADPGPEAEGKLRAAIDNAWPALRSASAWPGASRERLRFVASVEEAVAKADFIQENAPEREELKRDLWPASTPPRGPM